MSALALGLSATSVFIERLGPETASYGNLCGPAFMQPCLEPVLKGGFPLAFLFDQAGVSVEHRLSIGEDALDGKAFALNTLLYFWAGTLIAGAVSWARGKRQVRASGAAVGPR